MRMYTLQEVPKDLRAPSFRLERIGRTLSMTSLLEHIYVSTFVDFQPELNLELVPKELNHFGVIAGLFRQIGGHSSRFVLFCSF